MTTFRIMIGMTVELTMLGGDGPQISFKSRKVGDAKMTDRHLGHLSKYGADTVLTWRRKT
jgi:hypothetical protein